jgi:hypothetical protein
LLKTAKAAVIPYGRNGGPNIRPSSGGSGGRGFHATGSNQTNQFSGSINSRTGAEASNFQTTTNISVIVEVAAADLTMAGMYRNLLRLLL